MDSHERRESDGAEEEFTTGFFDPTARAAGETMPDVLTVQAKDLSHSPDFHNRLHKRLNFGRFELWPKLTKVIDRLRRTIASASDGEDVDPHLVSVCQQGALLYLRSILLPLGLLPHYDWDSVTTVPRCCERFGDGYASFAHYDLRLPHLRIWNLWVPVSPVGSEPLLLFATDAMDGSWRVPTATARHLPPAEAARAKGEWYYFRGLRPGQAILFPGDGGSGAHGIFHASASSTSGTRVSFDVREVVCSANGHEGGVEDEATDGAKASAADGVDGSARDPEARTRTAELKAAAMQRQAADLAEWEIEVQALLNAQAMEQAEVDEDMAAAVDVEHAKEHDRREREWELPSKGSH